MEIPEVYRLEYETQNEHFVDFLHWLKAGNHAQENNLRTINNGTCNAYLEDVFRFYLFVEAEYEQLGSLKVLSYNYHVAANAVGVQKELRYQSFKGYLKAEERKVRPAEHEEIITLLQACTNCRDQLLLLLFAETGFRIGEILGVNYIHDIDYQHHMVGVYFREDNENDARAKNAEYRKAKISDDTFDFLMYYLAEYRELLQHQGFLFINIAGKTAGQPLKVDSVYDMLTRLEKKTGIDLTPHMFRRYFANRRRKAGWRLELIQQALGHKHIETTIRYLNIVDDELLEASREFYEKHSPMYGVEKLL
uniref:tyrosine-type recombinase/integrase n=1 Tax=Enterocloster clostridioformis TaxID=1531 RepID=UPI0026F19430|nr:tyrosine-type recombinase/integrase [Enterocloster clostridioformis]